MKIKKNTTLSILIILPNIPLLYWTVKIIVTKGGPWGFGIVLLPLQILAHFFLHKAIKILRNNDQSRKSTIYGFIGTCYCFWLLWFYLYSI